MDSGNTNAVRGLANIYRQQSPEKAEAFIASLSASQRRSIDDIERSLQNDRLAQQAEALENQGKWAQAAALQRQRLALDPGSVWITYRLSQDLWQAGQRSQADTLMRNLAQQKPNDPEQVYAYGLYLSGHDQDRAALAHINSLPRAQWNSNIQELVNRLQSDQVLETANRLRESGKEAEAEAMLRQQPPSTRIDLTLADWAQQRRDYTAARAAYQNVLTREPANADAILGLTEVDIAQAQLGDTAAAQQTFNKLIPQAKSQPPSMESAMVLRDGAKFEAQAGDPTQALETYKDAMVASGVTTTRPQDNDTFTRLTRNDEKDDWLKRGVRSDAADLYPLMPMANGMTTGAPVHYRTVAATAASRTPVPAWRSAGEMTSGAGISVPRRWASTWWMWSAASVTAMISGRWVTPLTPTVGPSPVLCWPLVGKKTPRAIPGKNGVVYVPTVWG